MTSPFVVEGDAIGLSIPAEEREVLKTARTILDGPDPAGGRLDYAAHASDPDAEAAFRDLTLDDLEQLRRTDRAAFNAFVDGLPGPPEALEAFMRVVGEIRLSLAARLGIEDDGWESDEGLASDPELALLAWLGYLQDAAVELLVERM